MRYRKKPVVIEAQQWDGSAEGATAIIDWVLANDSIARYACDGPGVCESEDEMDHHLAIDTLEGTMRASAGDWIIQGVSGEFYPCKPDIFDQTYEPVDAQASITAQVYDDKVGKIRWRAVHANGNIMADSGQGYADERDARHGIQALLGSVPIERVKD